MLTFKLTYKGNREYSNRAYAITLQYDYNTEVTAIIKEHDLSFNWKTKLWETYDKETYDLCLDAITEYYKQYKQEHVCLDDFDYDSWFNSVYGEIKLSFWEYINQNEVVCNG